MTHRFKIISKTVLAFFLATNVVSGFCEVHHSTLLKNDIKQYHDSGRYEQELTAAIVHAQQYIIDQAKIYQQQPNPKKLAVVLDIDETSLSNYEKMVHRDFAASKAQIHREILAANALPIKPMLKLYNTALEHGIKIFFITGRRESERNATKMNLLKAGYKHWAGLYVRPEHYTKSSITPFKSAARAEITKKGYLILASIGDQYSDLKGGYAEKGFKLPNPFYYLP